MIDPTLHQQFTTTVTDMRRLIDRVDAEGREPSAEDAERYGLLAARAEELRRACLPVPAFDFARTC